MYKSHFYRKHKPIGLYANWEDFKTHFQNELRVRDTFEQYTFWQHGEDGNEFYIEFPNKILHYFGYTAFYNWNGLKTGTFIQECSQYVVEYERLMRQIKSRQLGKPLYE